ncbi:MAG TPA: hypothetical protein VKT28_12555 [Puia sp.]|nr:hypothetical protein [Puia sp.]
MHRLRAIKDDSKTNVNHFNGIDMIFTVAIPSTALSKKLIWGLINLIINH